MRNLWVPALFVAGTAIADPIPETQREGVEIDPEPRSSSCGGCVVSAPKVLAIRGTLRLSSSGDLAIGATVVATARDGKLAFTAITDEDGTYKLELTPGFYQILVYYLDSTLTLERDRMFLDDTVLDTAMVDDVTPPKYDCWYIGPYYDPSPELTAMPYFGMSVGRKLAPITRDRTHRAWSSPVAMADPARVATNIEGGRRFTAAPGIPRMFVEEVSTFTWDVPAALAQGGGGATDVRLRFGSNQRTADAKLLIEADRRAGELDGATGAETFFGGPLSRDHAWAAAGLVLRRDAGELVGDGMLRFDAMSSIDHSLMIAGIAHEGLQEDAGWAIARWTSHFHDHKVELGANLTGETLARSSELAARALDGAIDGARDLDRVGGAAHAQLRFKAAGAHLAWASAGGGVGERDQLRHTDASYAVGDDWLLTPSLTLTTVLRLEERALDGDRARVLAPRAALKWDPTHEGRAQLFVAYQRVPLLDDGLPGDWASPGSLAATSVDELAAGMSHSHGQTMAGVAVRQRDTRTGGEVWLRRETSRTVVHVQAASLDRTATLLAQGKLLDRRGTQVTFGTSARASEDHRDAGLAAGFKHSPGRRETTLELGAEAFAGTDGPGGRLVVGILW